MKVIPEVLFCVPEAGESFAKLYFVLAEQELLLGTVGVGRYPSRAAGRAHDDCPSGEKPLL
jgi:hypothetical protein